ncbi:hypothetical protein [Pengzhenrongella phosphoraccumulans]|uniref:hypothetical protein n=1 Tax=Pengzhenrongella phosphoraccumulans TaxID=3114394 RepID=UPI00388E0C5E
MPTVVLARELTPARVKAEVRSGTLERVRPGAYRPSTSRPATTTSDPGLGPNPTSAPSIPSTTPVAAAAARELALARIAAVGRQLRTPFWFSHESAALIWGCATWQPPDRTHMIQTVRPHGCGDPGLVRHLMALAPEDRQRWRGVPLTSLDRTVVDCLTRLDPLEGLVIADSALHLGADRTAIAARIEARAGGRGVATARAVLAAADGRAESPWETRVRHILISAGLPRPELQLPVHTRLGWFWADLGWRDGRLLIEFDGFVKYSTLADGDPAAAVFAEKRRQDAIAEENWGVLRVTAADLRHPKELVLRVCRRFPARLVDHLVPIPALTPW